jgi:hypothetical protein
MLHKLIDTLSGKEILSDDKWLSVYKKRAGVKYIGPVDEAPEPVTEPATEVAESTTKRKKSK